MEELMNMVIYGGCKYIAYVGGGHIIIIYVMDI